MINHGRRQRGPYRISHISIIATTIFDEHPNLLESMRQAHAPTPISPGWTESPNFNAIAKPGPIWVS
jgi:hypothetical protein